MTGSLLPLLAVEQVEPAEANTWVDHWAHPLGACERPFHQEAHMLIVDGRPAAATVSASTVSATSAGFDRGAIVELARIARAPEHPWVMRPMLRIWRAVLAQRWSCWPVRAAVSYALPGYLGDIYRFDGWKLYGEMAPSGGGGTWSNGSRALGRKRLWFYEYEAVAA